jgi:xylose isomerase
MRTYLILKEKAKRFDTDPEIQAALKESSTFELAEPSVGKYSSAAAQALKADPGDPDKLATRGYGNERLDQLVMELLLGVR